MGIYPDEAAATTETAERRRDRRLLLEALAGEGLLPRERFGDFLRDDDAPTYAKELGEAIHLFLARTRARLVLVQLEDVVGEGEQANLPGTSDSHPNWQRRLAARIEDIVAASDMTQLAGRLGAARRQVAPETPG